MQIPTSKVAYKIVDGTPDPGIVLQKVEMRGDKATDAFKNVIFTNGKTEIQLESGVDFWVNSSTTDVTQQVVRSRVK